MLGHVLLFAVGKQQQKKGLHWAVHPCVKPEQLEFDIFVL